VQSLSLTQFTAFEQATFEFCPGLNLLIGANGTGKTHVMKVMYGLLKVYEIALQEEDRFHGGINDPLHTKFRNIFRVVGVNELIRYDFQDHNFELGAISNVDLGYNDIFLQLQILQPLPHHTTSDEMFDAFVLSPYDPQDFPQLPPLIYLPAQEFLSINEGFIATYTKRELPYDETYYDLSLALNALPLRSDQLGDLQEVITLLNEMITGEKTEQAEIVTQNNGRFTFSLPEGKLDAHLVAEGYRKIATLLYLLRNGSLTKDSILFWDEPEANLNPRLIVQIARVLRMLAALGLQIFVTTHDYLLSHELSLLAEYPAGGPQVETKFFALHRPHSRAGVLVETGQTLAEIEHNPILQEFANHYDREATLFQQSAPLEG
jgi:energy-coupling factor transporter ATP-binding protein EcfA2